MKILVSSIIDLYKSTHNSRLHQLLSRLCEKHEISVISINDWWKCEFEERIDDYNKDFQKLYDSIEIYYLTNKKISPIFQEAYSINSINKILKRLKLCNFDLHFNYNTLFSGYLISRKFKKENIPSIYDLADDLPEMIRNSPQIYPYLKNFASHIGDFLLSNNISISNKITTTTNILMKSYSMPKEKTEILQNGVDVNVFKKMDPHPELIEKLNPNKHFILGYVGVLREWVDFKPIFNAIKFLQNICQIRIIIVGGGSEFDSIKKQITEFGLDERVLLTGTIPYNKIPEYIACMDVCIIPFKYDAISRNAVPLKLFEYMACEKPIICNKLDAVITEIGGNIFYASNSKEYASKILELYNNSGLRKEMGYKGRKIVIDKYEWNYIASRLERIMLGVIS